MTDRAAPTELAAVRHKFRLLPKFCREKEESFAQLSRDYISRDLQLSTLLRDSKDILRLAFTPTVSFLNESRKMVRDLSTVPKGSVLVVLKSNPSDANRPKPVLLFLNMTPRPSLLHQRRSESAAGGCDEVVSEGEREKAGR
jgi:hypothetical protein